MKISKFNPEYKALAQSFTCGNIIIDHFLQSSDALDLNQGITYVLLSDDNDFIIRYYNISAGRVDHKETTGNIIRYIPMGGAVNINYLAVDKKFQHTISSLKYSLSFLQSGVYLPYV